MCRNKRGPGGIMYTSYSLHYMSLIVFNTFHHGYYVSLPFLVPLPASKNKVFYCIHVVRVTMGTDIYSVLPALRQYSIVHCQLTVYMYMWLEVHVYMYMYVRVHVPLKLDTNNVS